MITLEGFLCGVTLRLSDGIAKPLAEMCGINQVLIELQGEAITATPSQKLGCRTCFARVCFLNALVPQAAAERSASSDCAAEQA